VTRRQASDKPATSASGSPFITVMRPVVMIAS
jgi:hypothetical protein